MTVQNSGACITSHKMGTRNVTLSYFAAESRRIKQIESTPKRDRKDQASDDNRDCNTSVDFTLLSPTSFRVQLNFIDDKHDTKQWVQKLIDMSKVVREKQLLLGSEKRSTLRSVYSLGNDLSLQDKLFHLVSLRKEYISRCARPIISKFMTHSKNINGLFNKPVDTKLIPSYQEIIKKPMDLGTVKNRIQQGFYNTLKDCIDDIILVFNNATTFNPQNHFVHNSAKFMLQELKGVEVKALNEKFRKDQLKKEDHDCTHCNGNTCMLCGEKCLKFDTPVQICAGTCRQKIKKNSIFYITSDATLTWCQRCYGNLPSILGGDSSPGMSKYQPFPKKELLKRKLDEDVIEPTIECDKCGNFMHQVCALYIEQKRGLSNMEDEFDPSNRINSTSFQCPYCDVKSFFAIDALQAFGEEEDMREQEQQKLSRRTLRKFNRVVTRYQTLINSKSKDIEAMNEESSNDGSNDGITSNISVTSSNHSLDEASSQAYTQSSLNIVEGSVNYRESPCEINNIKSNAKHFHSNDDLISPGGKPLQAKSLPSSKLSGFLEGMVSELLNQRGFSEVAHTVTIRVVSNKTQTLNVPTPILQNMMNKDGSCLPENIFYKQKCILLFQRIDGIDVNLFCLYVQEFDNTCPAPNTSTVYIQYLDSVDFFRPAEARTIVYQEILVGYLKWAQLRGFKQGHIWSCPPQRGDNFIFWGRPFHQKTPSRERLNGWYNEILFRSSMLGIVHSVGNLWESYFEQYSLCKGKKLKDEDSKKHSTKSSNSSRSSGAKTRSSTSVGSSQRYRKTPTSNRSRSSGKKKSNSVFFSDISTPFSSHSQPIQFQSSEASLTSTPSYQSDSIPIVECENQNTSNSSECPVLSSRSAGSSIINDRLVASIDGISNDQKLTCDDSMVEVKAQDSIEANHAKSAIKKEQDFDKCDTRPEKDLTIFGSNLTKEETTVKAPKIFVPVCPPIFEGDFWVLEYLRLFKSIQHKSKGGDGSDKISNQRKCKEILKNLMSTYECTEFCKPVDSIYYTSPFNYGTIIEHPMDLGTVKEKLADFKYNNMYEFFSDIRLTFDNGLKFNAPEHFIHRNAAMLKEKIKESSLQVVQDLFSPFGSVSENVRAQIGDSFSEENLCDYVDIFLKHYPLGIVQYPTVAKLEEPKVKTLSTKESKLNILDKEEFPKTTEVETLQRSKGVSNPSIEDKEKIDTACQKLDFSALEKESDVSIDLDDTKIGRATRRKRDRPQIEENLFSKLGRTRIGTANKRKMDSINTRSSSSSVGKRSGNRFFHMEDKRKKRCVGTLMKYSLTEKSKRKLRRTLGSDLIGAVDIVDSLLNGSDKVSKDLESLPCQNIDKLGNNEEDTPSTKENEESKNIIQGSDESICSQDQNSEKSKYKYEARDFQHPPPVGYKWVQSLTHELTKCVQRIQEDLFTFKFTDINDNSFPNLKFNSSTINTPSNVNKVLSDTDRVQDGSVDCHSDVKALKDDNITVVSQESSNQDKESSKQCTSSFASASLSSLLLEEEKEKPGSNVTLNIIGRRKIASKLMRNIRIDTSKCFSPDVFYLPNRCRAILSSVDMDKMKVPACDPDVDVQCSLVDSRHAFLEMCQFNHFQFDTLRRAKYSSLHILYYLLNPQIQYLAKPVCGSCNKVIDTLRWHCGQGGSLDLCTSCYDSECVLQRGGSPVNGRKQIHEHVDSMIPYRITF